MSILTGISFRRRFTLRTTTGEVAVSVTSTVSCDGEVVLGGRVAADVDTIGAPTGVALYAGDLSVTSDSIALPRNRLTHLGENIVSSDTTVDVSGSYWLYAALAIDTDSSSVSAGTMIRNAISSISSTSATLLSGTETFAGKADVTSISTALIAARVIWAATLLYKVSRFNTAPIGHIMLYDIMSLYFGTRTEPLGRLTLGATVVSSTDSVVLATAINYKLVTLSLSSTSITNIQGTATYAALMEIDTDSNVVNAGLILNEASVHFRTDVHCYPREDLTKGAKCGIIGESNVNIEAQNLKYAILSSESDTEVLLSGTMVRTAASMAISISTVTLLGVMTRSSSINSVSQVDTNLEGYRIIGCKKATTDITQESNSTTIVNTTNESISNCTIGE